MDDRKAVAVVTGAASGIGLATTQAFLKQGTNVIAVDLDRSGLDNLAEQASAKQVSASARTRRGALEIICGNINDSQTAKETVNQAKNKFGRIDYLFNNAGHEFVAPLLETTEDDWDKVMDVNLKGLFLMTKACLEVMVSQGSGVIINNASDAGLRGIKLNAVYSTSKAGIIHFTRSLALDYSGLGIRTNCICPGCIATPLCERFNREVGAREGRSGEAVLSDFVRENIPMQRVGRPEEIAQVVLFLCSAEASYVSGAIIPVDGALTAGM